MLDVLYVLLVIKMQVNLTRPLNVFKMLLQVPGPLTPSVSQEFQRGCGIFLPGRGVPWLELALAGSPPPSSGHGIRFKGETDIQEFPQPDLDCSPRVFGIRKEQKLICESIGGNL